MKKLLKWLVIVLFIAFLGIQFRTIDRENPAVDPTKTLYATHNVPANVQAILNRSCKDCHSNETHWPWYTHVAPSSWLVASDVQEGRDEMNFSIWSTYPPRKQLHKIDGICKMVTKKEMPLWQYTLIHRNAVLSQADRDAICQWTESVDAAAATPSPSATPAAVTKPGTK